MMQVEVQIMGQSYILNCPEGGEISLQTVVARVDKAMCRIRDAGKVKARDRIAVLAALNLAFEDESKADPAKAEPAKADTTPVKATQTTGADDAALLALAQRIDAVLAGDDQLI